MHGFRFEPTTTRPDRVVTRPRLLRQLGGRFDHRITTVVGAAGFGKTTALALAVENNHLDPFGTDVWLGLRSADDDPASLIDGLARAVGLEPSVDNPATIDRICDLVWSKAPEDIAIIVDDAHNVRSEEARRVVIDLLEALPSNGHLVLASRRPLDIPLGRLRVHGQLLEITEHDLDLDDDELIALAEHRQAMGAAAPPMHELTRHAATADLQLLVGAVAGSDFLWEEVLSGLGQDRLLQLQRAAVLEAFDAPMIDELTDGAFTVTELVAGLPLVEVLDDGTRRLHAILREALTSRLTTAARRKATAVAADIELRRNNYRDAVKLYLETGDLISVRDIARASILRPAAAHLPGESAAVLHALHRAEPARSLLAACELSDEGLIGPTMIPRFRAAAELARSDNDVELEAAMLYRLGQSTMVTHELPETSELDRLDELAAGHPEIRALHSHLRSILLQFEHGDTAGAAALIDDYDVLGTHRSAAMRCERLFDLGRMEEVDRGLPLHDFSQLPPGTEGFVLMAMWLRGDFPPEVAHQFGDDAVAEAIRSGGPHFQIATISAATMSSLAAGEWESARHRSTRAAEIAATPVAPQSARLWAAVATAAVTVTVDGDEAAASAVLDPSTTGVHLEVFPYEAYLVALSLLYIVQPEARPALDTCDIGNALRTAIDAGRAVVALREHDDVRPAAELPWSRSDLLRNNVLPPHLAELACAALAADPGNTAAIEVLESLPHLAELLGRVERHAGPRTVAEGRRRGAELPTVPDRHLAARFFGAIDAEIDGEAVDEEAWERRPRVRELFAYVVDRGRVSRSEVVEDLWPGHADEKRALGNLRSTLALLTNSLAPGQNADSASTFIRVEEHFLVASETITTDVGRFEALLAAARADDRLGLPARALDSYLAAIDVYRGDFLADVAGAWAVIPRLRLQSNAVGAMCRAAELLTAKGEPESAMRLAERVQSIDMYNDRAARLFVTSLAATGTISAARTAGAHLLAEFQAAGINASHELQRAIDRLGPSAD